MDYVRLWTTVHDDPKLQKLSPEAFRYYINALSWCGRHETEGRFEPIGKVPRMVTELVERGCFLPLDDGAYYVNGWDKRQVSKDVLEARRERGRKGAHARWHASSNATSIAPSIDSLDAEGQVEGQVEVETPPPDRSPGAENLCTLLADLVESNGSKRPTITQRWLDEADRMLRLDERSLDEAEALIRWCQADPFWRSNVLSMVKFRAKYDQLRLRRDADRGRASEWDAIGSGP